MNDIQKNKIIFWDQVSMVHKNQFNLVEKSLQQIHNSTESFGGIKVVIMGDFRQILSIVKGASRNDIYEVVIKRHFSCSKFSTLSLKINVRIMIKFGQNMLKR